jgi:ABC-type antimicrobial peptide transport system permease subunit
VAAWIAGSVGSLGVFLAALGLYGLAAFVVGQRTREIAIRMALGASPRDVRSMVLGQAARLGAIGMLVGVVLALGLGRLVQGVSLLVGVQRTDPATFGGMAMLMSAVLFAASYLPARRALSTDPAVALRVE